MRVIKSPFLLFVFFLLVGNRLLAQQKVVEYTKDFSFKEGVFLSFSDFKNNSPVPVSKIVFATNKGDRDYLKFVLDKKKLIYLDSLGKEQEVETSKVWGYCSNDVVYINYGTSFNRVVVIGSITHFVATTQTEVTMINPYRPYDPYYNRTQYTYSTGQYIMDFESGNINEFNVENMEALLQRDGELYKTFTALSKKKKKESVFIYLRKYNDKHPIYFPL